MTYETIHGVTSKKTVMFQNLTIRSLRSSSSRIQQYITSVVEEVLLNNLRHSHMDFSLISRSCTGLVYLRFYGPLLGRGCFFSFLIVTQSVGLLGRGISPSQGSYLHTGQHKHRINANRHPCLEWDSNPRSQCLSGRRRFML
jgi:hypothetical protein